MCPYSFSIANISFVTKSGERETNTYCGVFYFVEWMDGTMLTSHRSLARGVWHARES